MARKKSNKLARTGQDFPECPHIKLFRCKSASECLGCYYNPIKKEAMWVEKGEDKKPATLWFYASKTHAKARLKNLEDIRLGKGLIKGGTRTYLKHSRKVDED